MNEKRTKHHRGRRKKKKGGLLSTIVLLIAVVVLCVSGYQLFKIYSEYNKGSSEYEKLVKIAVKEKEGGEEDNKFTVDFDALKGINEDIAAWIRFDQPEIINYPVVQGKDNDEYLTRTFEANDNKLGTLFIDVDNPKDFSDRNTFIYGHNMKNKTMFAELLKYKDAQYFKDNPYFYIYTPDGKASKYQIFSAGVVKDVADNYQKVYESDEAYLQYLELLKSSSAHQADVNVDAASKIVSLSTCTNVRDDERFLVHGVKISEE